MLRKNPQSCTENRRRRADHRLDARGGRKHGNHGNAAAEYGRHGAGSGSGKVNLNTAGKEELMTLSGIGESRADAIIAYREANGPFGSIEEIMNIEGIKERCLKR